MLEYGLILSIIVLCLTYDNESKNNTKEENSYVPLYKIRYTNSSGGIYSKIMSQYDIEMNKVNDTTFTIITKLSHWGNKKDNILW